MSINWSKSVAYTAREKEAFHNTGRARLRKLAAGLGFEKGSYDIRSNKGGVAVSGEVTLHHDRVYVQIAQSMMGPDKGIMFRTCEGRKDYTGGRNNFAPLSLLNDIPALVGRVREIMPQTREEFEREQELHDESMHRLGN